MSNDFMPGLPEDEMSFSFRKMPVSKETQENNWKHIEESIQAEAPVKKMNWLKPFAVAASVVLIVASAFWYFSTQTEQSTNLYTTTFAKTKKITLPDGSKVILNANSQLRLSPDWSDKGDRQVWLDGEAYFEVEKKQLTHQKFIVHTKDIDVEVLGTKFNVNTRHERAMVSLEEGKIKLTLTGKAKPALNKPGSPAVIEMKPGELVKLDTAVQVVADSNIQYHSGWVRNEFHFNNTSLREIGDMIHDIYGYTLEAQDEDMLKRTISGDLRASNLQELLNVLQIAFKLKITTENKTIKVNRY